jgi:hypothetical protein
MLLAMDGCTLGQKLTLISGRHASSSSEPMGSFVSRSASWTAEIWEKQELGESGVDWCIDCDGVRRGVRVGDGMGGEKMDGGEGSVLMTGSGCE